MAATPYFDGLPGAGEFTHAAGYAATLVYMYNSFRWHLHRLLSETDAFIVGDEMVGYCNTVTFLQKTPA